MSRSHHPEIEVGLDDEEEEQEKEEEERRLLLPNRDIDEEEGYHGVGGKYNTFLN